MDKPGVTPLMELGKRSLRIGNHYVREIIGEFFGTLLVGFMCVGAGGQFLVNTTGNRVESQIVPVLGIILGIMTAILITGGVSGGHVNPAVSIGLAVVGELSWYSVPGYILSQTVGAIIGALLGWSLIHPSLRIKLNIPNSLSIPDFDMQSNTTNLVGIFSPIDSPGCTLSNGLATELVLTCFLIMAICGVVDKQSAIKPPGYLVPILIPLVIASFCFAHSLPTGTLLNPARDVGPRIAAWILGWPSKRIFMSKDHDGNEQHWWVVGLFGPILGAILGAFIYSFIIGPQVNTEHLEVDDMLLHHHQRDGIRQVVVGAADDGNWRRMAGSNTTTITNSSSNPNKPPVSSLPTNNVGPYAMNNNNNNNFITEAYQQQRSPFQSSLYANISNHGYPSILDNKSGVNNGANLAAKVYRDY